MGLRGSMTAAAIVVSLFACADAQATPGDLDEGFGRGGLFEVALPDDQFSGDLSVNATGAIRLAAYTGTTTCDHIYCTSDFDELLAAATPHGHLDPSFGNGGLLEPGIALDEGSRLAIALSDDGSLFATAAPDRLDRFGPQGEGPTSLPAVDGGVAHMVVLPSGEVLVGATSFGENARFSIERRLPSGAPDTSFGIDGKATAGVGMGTFLDDLVVDPDGGFWAIGRSSEGSVSLPRLTIAHFNADGSPDPGFSGDGIETYNVAFVVEGAALVGPDLIVASDSADGTNQAIRVLPDGTTDPSFGSGGRVNLNQAVPGYVVGLVGLAGDRVGVIQWEGLSMMDADGHVDPEFGGGDRIANPYGLHAEGAVEAGDGVLLYGSSQDPASVSADPDIQIARFELSDDGVADADADGITDAEDVCPDTYEPTLRAGCPRVERAITLKRGEPGNLRVRLRGVVAGTCPDATVTVTRRVAGKVARRWRQSVSSDVGSAVFAVGSHGGRFRASVGAQVSPPAGVCSRARSEILRIRR